MKGNELNLKDENIFNQYLEENIKELNDRIQKLQNEIDTLESDIDSLQMQKQELVSFNRVAEVATSKGYTYQNDATASTTGAQQ